MAILYARASDESATVDVAPVTGDPLVMACWINCSNIADEQAVMGIYDASVTNEWIVIFARGNASDKIASSVRSSAAGIQVANTTTAYSQNTWHHVCLVYATATNHSIFIDGGSKATNTGLVNPLNLDRVRIGRTGDSTPSGAFDGRIAEPVIWNASLTDAQVAELATGINPLRVKPENIVFYPPCFNVSSDPTIELIQGNDLTLDNTPATADHPPVEPYWSLVDYRGRISVAAAETITTDKWHPAIQQPYPHTNQVIPYQKY